MADRAAAAVWLFYAAFMLGGMRASLAVWKVRYLAERA